MSKKVLIYDTETKGIEQYNIYNQMDTDNYNCFAVSKKDSSEVVPLHYGFQLILSENEKALDLEPELKEALQKFNINKEIADKAVELQCKQKQVEEEVVRLNKIRTINEFITNHLYTFYNSKETVFADYVTDYVHDQDDIDEYDW